MSHIAVMSEEMRSNTISATHQQIVEMENQAWQKMTLPPTPPSPFIHEPPYARADSGVHLALNRNHNPLPSYYDGRLSSGMQMGMNVAEDVGMGGDAQLFEDALAEMLRDRDIFSAKEAQLGCTDAKAISVKTPVGLKRRSVKNSKQSRDRGARAKKAERPPALAATHPSLYTPKIIAPQGRPQTTLPTPPPEQPPVSVTNVMLKAPMPTPEQAPPLPPWRTYTDPNMLISAEPRFDDPMFRMLKIDVTPDRPHVVSPLFMIGMPCGSLIEAANDYTHDDLIQPRDAPSA